MSYLELLVTRCIFPLSIDEEQSIWISTADEMIWTTVLACTLVYLLSWKGTLRNEWMVNALLISEKLSCDVNLHSLFVVFVVFCIVVLRNGLDVERTGDVECSGSAREAHEVDTTSAIRSFETVVVIEDVSDR